jgi:hypothetical protein
MGATEVKAEWRLISGGLLLDLCGGNRCGTGRLWHPESTRGIVQTIASGLKKGARRAANAINSLQLDNWSTEETDSIQAAKGESLLHLSGSASEAVRFG